VLPEFHAVSVQAIEVRLDGPALPIVGPSGAVHRARPNQRATPGATIVVRELLLELDASVQRNAEEAILSAHLVAIQRHGPALAVEGQASGAGTLVVRLG